MTSKEAVKILGRLVDKDYEIHLDDEEKDAIAIALNALDDLHSMAESWYCIDEEGS